MNQIHLRTGEMVLVDPEDYEYLSKFKWGNRRSRSGKGVCAVRNAPMVGGRRPSPIMMHREILGLLPGDPRKVDHINGNTFDNRKSNLRVATHAQNCQNSKKRKDNSTGFKGVWKEKRTGRFCAEITAEKIRHRLGTFRTAVEAAAAYRSASLFYHKDFARLS